MEEGLALFDTQIDSIQYLIKNQFMKIPFKRLFNSESIVETGVWQVIEL